MMTCRELAELLLDFVSGELPPENCERVDSHLRRCASCIALVETYRLTITLTRRLPCSSLPEHLEARLRSAVAARINEERPNPSA
jgi:RNA polymerase sigma-70 factor (ECF subfamily)